MAQLRDNPTARAQTAAKYRAWEEYETEERQCNEAFKDLLQRDPVVCDTCFTQRYDVYSVEWWRGEFGWMDYVKWTSRDGLSEELPCDGDPTGGMRLACATCGTRGGVKHRPVPGRLVAEYTANISNTLADKRIDHDPHVLHRHVREQNTSENQCKQDSHVFGPAVKAAIRATDSHGGRYG